jgi:hypothetical protein
MVFGMNRRMALAASGAALLLAALAPAARAQDGDEPPQVEVNVDDIHVPTTTGKLVRPGIRVTAGCNVNCLLLVEVRLPRAVADRLGLSKTLIAEAVGDAQAGETDTMRAKVKPKVAERLGSYTGGKQLKIDVKGFP